MSSPGGDSPTEERAPGRRWVVPAVAAAAVVVVAVVVGVFALGGGEDRATVHLEAASAEGSDPFTPSVAAGDASPFPETVRAVIDTTRSSLTTDGATGTLAAPGATPGLYGGTRDDAACDTGALLGFLAGPENDAKARAWASAAGIEQDQIEEHLTGLTPSVLTVDTRVTNHGYADGAATPRQAVLQAGTAVLVDTSGVPRVRCSCGNPLAEPTTLRLASADLVGTAWEGYTADRVVTVAAAAPVDVFTFVDLTTGELFDQAPGSLLGGTWVAVAGGAEAGAGGSIHVSRDGASWEQALETDRPLTGLAHGGGRFVAVGGSSDLAAGGPGVVLTSTDGRTWSEPVEVARTQRPSP